MAGSWYPASRAALAAEVDAPLAGAVADVRLRARAIIVPHAGRRSSGPVAAHAYVAVRGGGYGAAVIVGPSHALAFTGVSVWPAGAWETPFGPVAVEERLARALVEASPLVHERPAAHVREHSLELQLPFIARLLPDTPIVPLVMGRQTRDTAETLGRAMAAVIGAQGGATAGGPGADVLLVASSDLSHYEDARTAAALDAVVLRHVDALDAAGLMTTLEGEPGHACGGGPIVSVLLAARLLGASRAQVVRYADSGDVTGDKSSVVGYMAAVLW
jgi:AmmeMemoRadiSam system protein B